MRNYTLMYWSRINWDVDINPPNPPTPDHEYFQNRTPEELQANVDSELVALAANPVNKNITAIGPQKIYWLMDKDNLSLVFAFAANVTLTLIDAGTPPAWIFHEAGTPRDGWTDGEGIKREPPPSEKPTGKGGASAGVSGNLNQLVTIIANLEAAYRKLSKSRSQHDQRLANVLRYNLDRMYQGLETIYDVLTNVQPFI